MMLFAAALILAAPLQDGCLSASAGAVAEDDEGKLHQAHGKGLWIGGIEFAPADLVSATAKVDEHVPEIWQIEIVFSAAGNAKFVAAQRCGVDAEMEISLDAKLVSRPNLAEPILGPSVMISGGFTKESAIQLAEKLSAPAAP